MRVFLRNPIFVFSHDSNPAIDRWLYRISPSEAQARLDRGYVRWIAPNRVQLNPPPGYSPDQTNQIAAGLFERAWQPRFSDHYLVWQMRSQREQLKESNETDQG